MGNYNISAFGSAVSLVASNTFPAGVAIGTFSDDADPINQNAIRIGDVAMGVNGDLINWRKAVPIPMEIAVVPGSQDDINLSTLANNNRAAQGKTNAQDVITLTIIYPTGQVITLSNGTITDAPFAITLLSAGRMKTNVYSLAFQQVTGLA